MLQEDDDFMKSFRLMRCITLLLVLALVFSAPCVSSAEEKDAQPRLEERSFELMGHSLRWPQVTGLDDAALEENVNADFLAMLLNSNSLGEFLTAIDDIGEIMESDKLLEDAYIAARENTERVKADYEEFKAGRGVKFGTYFYARLYLNGTSDASGNLTAKNGINVRFVNGNSFRLSLDQFSFSNVNGGDIPGAEFLISDVDGAQRGILKPEAAIMLNGVNLFAQGDAGTKVAFYEVDAETGEPAAEPTAEVAEFTSRGPNMLVFAWVEELVPGKTYFAVPSRSKDGEVWFTGAGKDASVEA
jgi:hypothetical protein